MVRSLVIFLALPTVAQSATLTVGPGQAYTVIQDAIDAAAIGDRIEVEAGTYSENLAIINNVELIGLSGSGSTIIDGGGNVMVNINASVVTIEGFTLDSTGQRGMEVTANSTVTGDDLVISGFNLFGNNEAAGLLVINSDVDFSNVEFENNFADEQGGAVAIHDSVATFTDCTFDGNSTNADGAGLGSYNSVVTLDTCTFDGNTAIDDGGALDIDDASDVTIIDSIFSGNVAGDAGGAITAEDGGSLTMDNSVFLNNYTPEHGGAIRTRRDMDLAITGGLFQGNETSGGQESWGGAMRIGDGTHTITDTIFLSNTTDDRGGALDTNAACDLTITSAEFSSNTAEWGGAMYIDEDSTISITTTLFDLNEATAGRGGAIRWRVLTGNLTVVSSTYSNNTAALTGGAISTWSSTYGDAGDLNLINNSFIANDADEEGGAVFIERADAVSVLGNTFCGNSAVLTGGGATVVDGAGTDNTWENNVFADNTSGNSGGAVRFDNSSNPDLTNNTFVGNDSGDGGHLRVSSTAANLTNNIFAVATSGNGVSQSNSNGSRDYNLWFNNTNNNVGGGLSPGDLGGNAVFGNPDLVTYTGDCFSDDYGLQPGSPAIDSGDPAIQDDDGSTSDIGAYGGPNTPVDNDGDGFIAFVDCDDNNAAVNPGATEICDGIDNDCNGAIDGADATDATSWYPDNDGDGFGDDDAGEFACSPPSGYVAIPGDCDDNDAAIHDGAYEACDGLDNDCDGQIDEGQPMTDYYADRDGDGYGDETSVLQACVPPDGFVENTEDCDDFEPLAWTNNPESCDEIDNDCDGDIDEGAQTTFYEDGDGDGFGVDNANSFDACDGEDGFVDNADDCDDNEATVNPGEVEVCDNLDNNCDGEVNEGLVEPWFEDNDSDGYGNDDVSVDDCEEPNGHTAVGGDCNDEDPEINPGVEDDSNDQIDQDCDGSDGPKFAEEEVKGTVNCGSCNASGSNSAGWLAMLGVLLLVRRRR